MDFHAIRNGKLHEIFPSIFSVLVKMGLFFFFYDKFGRRLRAYPDAQATVSVLCERSFFQTLDLEGVWKMRKDFVSLNFVWKIQRSNFRVTLIHSKMVRIARSL